MRPSEVRTRVLADHEGLLRDLNRLAALLREDMREEEQELLDERVLRDDIVGIAVETG